MRNTGIIVTTPGSIIVASTRPNNASRPLNLKYEKPNATDEQLIVTDVAASSETSALLPNHFRIDVRSQTLT
jgi:hypothetical protein